MSISSKGLQIPQALQGHSKAGARDGGSYEGRQTRQTVTNGTRKCKSDRGIKETIEEGRRSVPYERPFHGRPEHSLLRVCGQPDRYPGRCSHPYQSSWGPAPLRCGTAVPLQPANPTCEGHFDGWNAMSGRTLRSRLTCCNSQYLFWPSTINIALKCKRTPYSDTVRCFRLLNTPLLCYYICTIHTT